MRVTEQYITRWHHIVAITPYYRANGRTGSLVHYADGRTERYPYRCEWLVEQLAKYFFTTTELAKERAKAMFDGADVRKVPLALQPDFCLVPLKSRNAERKGHGTAGYVVLQQIKRLQHAPDGNTMLYFLSTDAAPLHILQRAASTEKQINLAWMVQEQYNEEQRQLQRDRTAA